MVIAGARSQDDWFRHGMRWIDIYITEEVEVLNSDGLQGFMFSLQQCHQQQSWQVTGKESWYHQFFKSGLDLPEVVEQMLVYRMEKIDEVFSKRKQMACLFADSANSLYPFEVLAYIRLYNYIENTTIDIEHPYLEPFKNLTPLNKLQNKDLQKLDKLIDKKIEQIKKHGNV